MKKALLVLVILDLVAVNAAVGYLVYKNIPPELRSSPLNLSGDKKGDTVIETQYVDKCGEECMAAIAARVEELGSGRGVVSSPTVTPKPTAKPSYSQTTKMVREEILTIPGSGSGSGSEWVNLAGTEFYFDTRDYPGIKEVYFEANMKLFNGNGYGYVRLYDVTHGIGVTGSDNDTSSQADVWTKSQKVSFWPGRNLIRVQGKTLTADTVVYNSGRLRIVMEN